MKMPIIQVFFLVECDRTGCDVNEAAEEMWAKYRIHLKQVDWHDLVWNILPTASWWKQISNNCEDREEFEGETVDWIYSLSRIYSINCFMAFLCSCQPERSIQTTDISL